MSTKACYVYDDDMVYSYESVAYESPLEPGVFPLPANATFEAPPVSVVPFVPRWTGYSWELVEDHRKHPNEQGYYVGGTPFWLPEDNWESEARYMKELGSLPSNAIFEKPVKPQEVIEMERLEAEVNEAIQFLESTDYVTLKIIEEPETKEQYLDVLAKRKEVRAMIDPLQARIRSLSV